MPAKHPSVTGDPPRRSDSQPPNGLATEPISAPTKPSPARYVAMNGWAARNSGKVFLITSGSANE